MKEHTEAMSPVERRRAIAAILARGYLRMMARQAQEAPQSATGGDRAAAEKLSESRGVSLDVVRAPVPDVVEVGAKGKA